MISMFQPSNDLMSFIQYMAGFNPIMKNSLEAVKGKNEEQLKETVRKLARSRGMDDNQLNQFLQGYGLHL